MLSHLYATRKCSKTKPHSKTRTATRGQRPITSQLPVTPCSISKLYALFASGGMTRRGMSSPNVGYFQTVGYWRLETGRPLCSSRGSVIGPARTSAQGDGTIVICSGHEKRPETMFPPFPRMTFAPSFTHHSRLYQRKPAAIRHLVA